MNDIVIAEWLRDLDSTDPHRQADAAVHLGESAIDEARPALRELVEHDSDIVATAAMYACWQLGEDHVDVRRLLSALGSTDENVFQQAVQIVTAIGTPMVDKLAPFLHDDDVERAGLALRALDEIHDEPALCAVRDWKCDKAGLDKERRDVLEDWDD